MKIQNIKIKFTWKTAQDYIFVLIGSLIQAFAMRLFLVPALLTSGGISGLAQIGNHLFSWPVGLVTFLGNLPLFVLGWRYLGGARFALRTFTSLLAFSVFTDLLTFFIPESGVTSDIFLDTIYGGVVMGVGLGLVYRGRGTSGGTDIVCRMLNHYLGLSISVSYLIADGLVVIASGFAFGWTKALYGLVVIYVSGLAAEFISEGSPIFRAAMIVTNCPQEIAQKIDQVLERGATILEGTGAFSGARRPVLYCVVMRSEVNQLKSLVSETDPLAFMVIGQVHETLGEGKGFTPLLEE